MKTLNLHLHHVLRNATTWNCLDWTNNIREQLCVWKSDEKCIISISDDFCLCPCDLSHPIAVFGCLCILCQLRPSEHGQRPQFVVPDELRGTWHILTHLTSWHNSELCDAMLAAGYALLIFACSFSMLFSCFSHFLTWFACCPFRLEVKYLYALQQWCCLQAPKQSRSPRCRSVKRRETFWFGFWMVLSTDRIPTCRAGTYLELISPTCAFCTARFCDLQWQVLLQQAESPAEASDFWLH